LVTFLMNHKISISRFEEYTDAGRFFARLEWQHELEWASVARFQQDFQPIANLFEESEFQIHFFDQPQKLGLFVSKEPHALIEAINRCEAGDYPKTEICFLVSNDESMQRLADRHGIPFYFIKTYQDPTKHEPAQIDVIKKHVPDLIGLARYMKVLSAEFIEAAGCPIVNIHHSFLPSFVGAKPYEMAYHRGVKLIGATSHYVIPARDQGPIIEQDVIRVRPGASIEYLKKIGRQVERTVFATALEKVLRHKTITYDNKTIVFE